MLTTLFYLFLLAILAAGGWVAWQRFGGTGFFQGDRELRIGVSEVASVDGKRKLVLIHRDGVEHLIMTGGPVDVVIEQGIMPQQAPRRVSQPATQQQGYEPRFAAPQPQPAMASDPLGGDTAQPAGFGRLRQRAGQPQQAADGFERAPAPGLASGGRG